MPSSDGDAEPAGSAVKGLRSWWKLFKSRTDASGKDHSPAPQTGVFGVSLPVSLAYASVAISQLGPDGKARIYGHVPVVVAKTGLFLKENGVSVQGIFRVSGSNKRIKELEKIFDSPPLYGKDLTWETYSVHDAASVFRRYLNTLPEPVIPYELYSSFRDALPCDQVSDLTPAQKEIAVQQYKGLINSLPPASQHIFYYILDLLGVFARKSDVNLMDSANLATIFQPGLLRVRPGSGPIDLPADSTEANLTRARIEADAKEHKRSQAVLEFMISNQTSFELELPSHLQKPLTPKSSKTKTKTSQSLPEGATQSKATDATTSRTRAAELKQGASLVRRGSDKSEDRRRLRRKRAEELRLAEGGTVTVKRSRTLPSTRPTSSLPGKLQPLSQTTSNTPTTTDASEKERRWWRRQSQKEPLPPTPPNATALR